MKCMYTKNGLFSIYSKKQGGLKLLLMTVLILVNIRVEFSGGSRNLVKGVKRQY